jgi:hypothetical protein
MCWSFAKSYRMPAWAMTVRMVQETERITAGFARLDAADAQGAESLDAIADALLKLRYYARFLDEITAHEEATA